MGVVEEEEEKEEEESAVRVVLTAVLAVVFTVALTGVLGLSSSPHLVTR